MAGKAPASLFYWGDFARDPDLRRCTHAEVGVWFRILCLMFEAEFKGELATNGKAWTDEEIALAVGGDTKEAIKCVSALVTKGVASRNERGSLINRRMYREHLERVGTRERVRLFREREQEREDVTQPVTDDVTQVKRDSTLARARAETETETETKKKKKEAQIPDWIPQESWDGFVDNRKALRSPMTDRAVAMIVKQLAGFMASGQDPGQILDQSTANGWKGVFELRRGGISGKSQRNISPAAERVHGSINAFRRAAERSAAAASGEPAGEHGGGVSAPGGDGGDRGGIPTSVRGSGPAVRVEESRDGPAGVPDAPEILSPSKRSVRGA